jgi:GntR family transcriptional regulator
MFFEVDLQSPKAVYQQLIDQVKFAVASGRLAPGDRLPSIRDVAVAVRVNRNTVARVYGELEREGVVYTRPGQGCFVSDRGSGLSTAVRRQQLVERLDELLAQARLFRVSRDELVSLVESRLDVIYGAGANGAAKEE